MSDPADEPAGDGSARVAAGILASRVAGLGREVAIAAFLGVGPVVDAFTAAFRIPNLLQNLLGEGVLSASFIPSYSRLLAQGREREAARLAGTVATLLAAVTAVLVVLGVAAAEPLARLLAAGFDPERQALTARFIRIVTPGIGILVLSAWCLGVLNSHRRFFLSYVAPVVWNGAQIVALAIAGGLVYAAGTDAVAVGTALAWSTLVGAALQVALQLPAVWRLGGPLRPGLGLTAQVRGVLRAFVPVVGARGVVQVSALLDTLLASFLVVGAVTALRYAQILYLLPISLFGMSVAAAELPEMARLDRAERDTLLARLEGGMARIAFFVVPIAGAYLLVGDLLVAALLQRGAFDRAATLQVAAVLGGYAAGLLASTAARLQQSALYAVGDAVTPSRASVVRVALSAVLGVALMLQLDRVALTPAGLQVVGSLPAVTPVEQAARAAAAVPRLGALGLTLGAAAGAWVEYVLLRRAVRQRIGPARLGGGVLGGVLAAAVAAGAAATLLRPVTAVLPAIAGAVVALAVAAPVYLAVAASRGVDVRGFLGRWAGRIGTPRR